MKTGSLRTRVSLITLSLLAIVLASVITAVTFAYRSKLESDLRSRLAAAGTVVEHARSGDAAKPLVRGLALEGIATNIGSFNKQLPAGKGGPANAPVKAGSFLRAQGSLLTLSEVLPDGTKVVFSASRRRVDRSVTNLLRVELLVAAVAFALATLLVLRGTGAALRPLAQVVETASRITLGDSSVRLRPSRTDTELGRMAAAFDRMVDALEAAVADARASDAATRNFLAEASHELRTPIAALQSTAETLLREQPQRPDRDRLEAALTRDIARLGRLVDDLLDIARLEARPGRETLTLDALATTAIEEAQARAPRAQLTLTVSTDAPVEGDAAALTRIFRNLLDNSLKATSGEGNIHVHIGSQDHRAEAEVSDNGPGISAADRERIFERFVRLETRLPGSGLGLAIARRIARQHGGDLTCNPSNHGASFTLKLPIRSRTQSAN